MVERHDSPEPAGEDAARRHRRASDLFLELIERPASERPAALARIAAEDSGLAREVELLLAADAATASHPLDRPAVAAMEPAPPVEPLATVGGERSYRLLGEIGRGGMGVVHLAERADGEFRQQVAIKLLPGGAEHGEEMLRRFRTERQILAALDHPGIAKLLDGGSLADGTPYLVMEFVEGLRIDDFCERNALPTRARIRLFLDVCAAVAAAHHRLIVHRDLKPSNILVTSGGAAKLLDFGIAKLLDPESAGIVAAETRAGVQPLTLRYASPEQVRGEPVSTATDVYSLGVILYELLTGRHPLGDDLSVPELLRAIAELDPPSPSTIVERKARTKTTTASAPARRAELIGDLDAILLKALRKRPEDRYASVDALAEDLRRFLDSRPVEARRGSVAYRAGRFARRHRVPVAAGLLLVALLTAWAISLARQLESTRRERDHARAVTDLLVDVFKVADPEAGAGKAPTAREILDRGSEQVTARLADRPAVLARLLHALGRVYQNLGLPDQALEHIERAVALRRPDLDDDRAGFAVLLADAGWLLNAKNEFARAAALYGEALGLLSSDDARERTIVLNGLANCRRDSGDLAGAEPLFVELVDVELAAVGLVEPPGPEGPPLGEEYRTLAVQLHNLGALYSDLGRYDEATRFLRQALAVKSRYAKPNPASLANSFEALANVEDLRQRYTDSIPLHERALELRRGVYGDDHPVIGASLLNRGGALSALGRTTEALADYDRARDLLEAAYGRDHLYVAIAANNTANALWALGRLGEAEAMHREALAIRERVAGPDHADVAMSLQNLGGVLLAQGRLAEATEFDRRAVEVSTRALGADHPDTLDRRLGLAKDRLAAGEVIAATAELETLVVALERGQREHALADGRFALARALVAGGGDRERAVELATRARAALVGRTGLAGSVTEDEVAAWLDSLSVPGSPAEAAPQAGPTGVVREPDAPR